MQFLKVEIVSLENTIRKCGRADQNLLGEVLLVEDLGDIYITDDFLFIHKNDTKIVDVSDIPLRRKQEICDDLYGLIQHGSDGHKAWLKSVLEYYFLGTALKDYEQ